MTDELTRLFKRAAISAVVNEGVPGVMGKGDGTVYYTDPAGVKHRDRVWVRIGEGTERAELVVHAPGVPKVRNMPIIIADRGGTPTAIRTDWLRADIFTGGRASEVSQHSWTHQRLGTDPLYITGQAFLPLMARPTSPADMTVTVEPGYYRYHGTEKVFTQTVSADLSSFKASGALVYHFVVLCLDRDANSLYILDGTDHFTITLAHVLTALTGLNAKFFPLAVIRLYGGQTSIYAYDILYDARLWGGESDFRGIMTDVDTNIMIDANGNVMVGL